MSSQWGSQKLLQESICHKVTAYLSDFDIFFNSGKWSYYQMYINQITLNCTTLQNLALTIFEVFVWISVDVNLSLNQTLLTFLLCVRQIWMIQLVLVNSLWGVTFTESERILLLTCLVLQFMSRRDFFLHRIMFSTGITSLSVILLFPLLITFFISVDGIWCYFI